jgi:hypothetical protein
MGQDDPDTPWPVAIESDGTEQYRSMSVRERSRLRPQLLERLGWRYMPLWTIEVFTDPSACADRIAGYLGLEKVVLPGRATASANFFDDDVDPLSLEAYGNVSQEPDRPARADHRQQARPDRLENNQDRTVQPVKEETVHVTPTHHTAGPAGAPTPGRHQPGDGKAEEGTLGEGSAKVGPVRVDAVRKDTAQVLENATQENATRENTAEDTAQEDTAEDTGATPVAGRAAPGTAGILPNKAAEDDPRRWGDGPDDDHDAWLKEQKPPHWG